jgi:uncharacterized membrane protein
MILLRILVSALLVAFLPGHAILLALFPRKKLDGATKIALSLIFSLSIIPIGGIVLNTLPWGLHTNSWIILISILTFGAILIAVLQQDFSQSMDEIPLNHLPNLKFSCIQIMLLILTIIIFINATWLAYIGERDKPDSGFTQLSVVWADQEGSNILISVYNSENVSIKYRIRLTAGDNYLYEWQDILLESGESWQANYTLPLNINDKDGLQVDLFASEHENVYRQVWLSKDSSQ